MNNILDLSSSFDFNNNNVVKGGIEIDDVFELENNIEILVQDKIIEPTREIQTVTVDEDYDQLGTVTVNPIPDEYIIPDGTLDVDANGDVDVTMFRMARVGVYTPPTLQDKEVIPTKEEQIISYDEDYDGLNSVIVNSIPDEYIIPTGTLNINKNGTQDVNNYNNVKVKVESVANIGPKRLYLIKDGIEQTGITGGSAFLDMGLGTGYTSISQGNGYLGLCVAEATRSFTFTNAFDHNKYTKLCVEWAYPKADNYGNYIAPTIGVKISKQPSDDSMVKTFLMHGGSIRETKPKTITELDIVDAGEGSKVNIIIGRTGYGSDFPSYPAHIYNLYLESSAINLQDKSIEVVQNGTQIITSDTDYDGLNSITVHTNAIEDLTAELTVQNEEITEQKVSINDIKNALIGKAVADVPEKGFIISNYDSDGYPTEITILGVETVPNNFMSSQNLSATHLLSRISKVNLSNDVKSFGFYCFYDHDGLTTINFPKDVTDTGYGTFYGCVKLSMKTLPDNIKTIGQMCFQYNHGLIQLSMPNVETIDGTGTNQSAFGMSNSLKAVWIGSAITKIKSSTFYNCAKLIRIFIDKPRADVETLNGYSIQFGATNATIICNDDAGFMTKEEFDAINWSTYEG